MKDRLLTKKEKANLKPRSYKNWRKPKQHIWVVTCNVESECCGPHNTVVGVFDSMKKASNIKQLHLEGRIMPLSSGNSNRSKHTHTPDISIVELKLNEEQPCWA